MGKIYPISDELLRIIRRELRKHGVTLVKNKKTGVIFVRKLTTKPVPSVTVSQSASRQGFSERSRKASQWIKENGPKAYPPDGTAEYQKMVKSFKRQNENIIANYINKYRQEDENK